MAVPVGYKFQPSDEQLLGFFLRNRVANGPSTNPPMIYECDLYGEEGPWLVWAKYRPIYEGLFQGGAVDEDSDLYFFTKLKKKDPSHKRVVRTVGQPGEEGTWHGYNVGKQIRAQGSGVVIGITKMFTYKNSKSEHSGNWIMHEYTLNDGGNFRGSDNVVLCRLRRKHLIHVGADHNLVELNNQATDQREIQSWTELGPGDTADPGVVHGGEIEGAGLITDFLELGPGDTAEPGVVHGGEIEGAGWTTDFLELGPGDTADPGVVHGGEIDGAAITLPPYEVASVNAWIRDSIEHHRWTDLYHVGCRIRTLFSQ